MTPAIHLTNDAIHYLHQLLTQRIEPTPQTEAIRHILRTELQRTQPTDELIHPLTSAE